MDSQKVRLALEEKDVDYTSHHFNPLTGKNMDSFFFRMNPSAKLPVFQNGSHILCKTIDIIQYVFFSPITKLILYALCTYQPACTPVVVT